jgi:hypothetical protein
MNGYFDFSFVSANSPFFDSSTGSTNKNTLNAINSLWPIGNYCMMACGQYLPFGQPANSSPTPE